MESNILKQKEYFQQVRKPTKEKNKWQWQSQKTMTEKTRTRLKEIRPISGAKPSKIRTKHYIILLTTSKKQWQNMEKSKNVNLKWNVRKEMKINKRTKNQTNKNKNKMWRKNQNSLRERRSTDDSTDNTVRLTISRRTTRRTTEKSAKAWQKHESKTVETKNGDALKEHEETYKETRQMWQTNMNRKEKQLS